MGTPRDADARRYYRAGRQRMAEAEVILRDVRLPAAAVYLAGYGIECSLKALLVERTPESDRPATVISMKVQFGHHFGRLRAALVTRGVRLPPDIAGEVAFAARWSPELRYDPGPGNMATATRFLAAARAVVRWADRSL